MTAGGISRTLLVLLLVTGCGRESAPSQAGSRPAASPASGPVRVHDAREGGRLRSLLDVYQMQTRAIVDSVAEGAETKADLVIFGSLAELWDAAEADRFRPVFADEIAARIPASLRDGESRWTALSVRARPVFYLPSAVAPEEATSIAGYVDLGDERWRGRLCLSSSKVPGNRVLVASLVQALGIRDAEIAVRSWVANLAAAPFDTDIQLIAAVADGTCDIGIADDGELQRFAAAHQDRQLQTIEFEAPGGMLIDISGAGVGRHAVNPEGAVRLLKWLTDSSFNSMFAAQRHEYPANPHAAPASADPAGQISNRVTAGPALSELGFQLDDAALLVDRAHYP